MKSNRKELRKQKTFFKTLIIIAIGAALIATTLVMMIKGEGKKTTTEYSYTL
jgi:type IV secretory pathway component VirB8